MATRFNLRCHPIKGRCPIPEVEVPSVQGQIASWLMGSKNTQQVRMAKLLVQMMNKSKRQPSRKQKARLGRYVKQTKLTRG